MARRTNREDMDTSIPYSDTLKGYGGYPRPKYKRKSKGIPEEGSKGWFSGGWYR